EVIASRHGAVDASTAAQVMQRLYDLGMQPAWWKPEPMNDAAAWTSVDPVSAAHDPRCRGVLLLGLTAPIDELVDSFRIAAASPAVKGFAVGRTIFADTAEKWLRGALDDDAAVAELAARFGRLVDAWQQARGDIPATGGDTGR